MKEHKKKADTKVDKTASVNKDVDIFAYNDSSAGQIMHLNAAIGNRGLKRLIDSGVIQAKLKSGPQNNRSEQDANRAAERVLKSGLTKTGETATAKKTRGAVPGLIVDDSEKVLPPGGMRKTEFINRLHATACMAADEVLAGTVWETVGCPVISKWINYFRGREPHFIERVLLRYAPEAAGEKRAEDYLPLIYKRVKIGVGNWINTGEITGIPEGGAAVFPMSVSEETGMISFKAREGGAKVVNSLHSVRSRLGSGHKLDNSIMSRMGSVLGRNFSDVRIHTDADAARLSDTMNARAFTIGKDIAFASGEYKPGTLVGDALIAHELAHVVQQESTVSPAEYMKKAKTDNGAYEEDADASAFASMFSLWIKGKSTLKNISINAVPRLKSGLRLQSCKSKKKVDPDKYAAQMLKLLCNIRKNKREIIRKINKWDNLGAIIRLIIEAYSHSKTAFFSVKVDNFVKILGRTEEGQEILKSIIKNLGNEDDGRLKMWIRRWLREFATEDIVTKDEKRDLEYINRAINSDPNKEEYLKTPPLRFPVKLHKVNYEMFGGVYYNPYKVVGDRNMGVTITQLMFCPGSNKPYISNVYIIIGRLAVKTQSGYNPIATLQATMYHEFLHYKKKIELMRGNAPQTPEDRILYGELIKGGKANDEIRVTSIEIVSYFDKLPNDELVSSLSYLARYFGHPTANRIIQDAAIQRIRDFVEEDPLKQTIFSRLERLIDLVKQLDSGTFRNRILPILESLFILLHQKSSREGKDITPEIREKFIKLDELETNLDNISDDELAKILRYLARVYLSSRYLRNNIIDRIKRLAGNNLKRRNRVKRVVRSKLTGRYWVFGYRILRLF